MSIRSAICRLFSRRCKRALVIIGAGASVDFGLGATDWFGKEIEARLTSNTFCVANGGLDAYLAVRDGLTAFYNGEASEAHFERIYHALHEVAELTRPIAAAVPKFRPILQSLVDVKSNYVPTHPNGMGGFRDFEVACDAVIQAIYEIASLASDKPAIPLDSFAAFLRGLRRDHVVRAYTTNYDDFALQAAPICTPGSRPLALPARTSALTRASFGRNGISMPCSICMGVCISAGRMCIDPTSRKLGGFQIERRRCDIRRSANRVWTKWTDRSCAVPLS